MENDGVTEVHDYWPANAARAVGGYVGHLGLSDLNAIIDQADGANPMIYSNGIIVRTDPATLVH